MNTKTKSGMYGLCIADAVGVETEDEYESRINR